MIRGITHLDGDTLATHPRDEARGVLLRRSVSLGAGPSLRLQVAADPGRSWRLEIYADNTKLLSRMIEGDPEVRRWQDINVDLTAQANKSVELRLYQLVRDPVRVLGNAYWRDIRVEPIARDGGER